MTALPTPPAPPAAESSYLTPFGRFRIDQAWRDEFSEIFRHRQKHRPRILEMLGQLAWMVSGIVKMPREWREDLCHDVYVYAAGIIGNYRFKPRGAYKYWHRRLELKLWEMVRQWAIKYKRRERSFTDLPPWEMPDDDRKLRLRDLPSRGEILHTSHGKPLQSILPDGPERRLLLVSLRKRIGRILDLIDRGDVETPAMALGMVHAYQDAFRSITGSYYAIRRRCMVYTDRARAKLNSTASVAERLKDTVGFAYRRPLPLKMQGVATAKDIARFMSHVKIDPKTKCWVWQVSKSASGYGAFSWRSKVYPAHRVAFALFRGDIPKDCHVHHDPEKCTTPACVNPAHLSTLKDKVHLEIHGLLNGAMWDDGMGCSDVSDAAEEPAPF